MKYLFDEQTCAVCGKPFVVRGDDYVYKKRKNKTTWWYCGWSCLRKAEKGNEGRDQNGL